MAQRKTLTERQIDVLRWLADGCPPNVMQDDFVRISVGALRNRGLATTSGRGATWSAEITPAGRAYLDQVAGPNPPVPRPGNQSVTAALIDEIAAAGGALRVPRWNRYKPGAVDYVRRAELAERHGRVPPYQRLVIENHGDEVELRLVDAPPGAVRELIPVPVPGRVARYHTVVQQFREAEERHEVSTTSLTRVLRLLQGLVVEAERRGYAAAVPEDDHDSRSRSAWAGARHGHLLITVDNYSFAVRVTEDGAPARSYTEWDLRQTGQDRRRRWPRTKDGSGRLVLSIVTYYRTNRVSSWSDGKSGSVESKLPKLLREIEVRAAEARHERFQAEKREAERRQQWEAALAEARVRYIEHQREVVLFKQVAAWRQANELRAFCVAVETTHADDPNAIAWATWARTRVDALDPLAGELRLPDPPNEIRAEDLRPFLAGWDPYEPRLRGHFG
jgi:hypothetical protein